MRLRKLACRLALVAGLPALVASCGGASFDEPSVIKGLRVIAVQKSSPYPKVGENVDIKLLYWDGKATEDNPRDLFVYIARDVCVNPPGDLYYNCLASVIPTGDAGTDDDGGVSEGGVADGGAPDGGVPEGGVPARIAGTGAPQTPGFTRITGEGAGLFRKIAPSDFQRVPRTNEALAPGHASDVVETHVTIPTKDAKNQDIIRPRTGASEPYGLAYLLFMACAGHPDLVPNAGQNQLPFGCFDNTDNHLLGADDFVVGYTSMYIYDNRVNNNPVMDDFTLNGNTLVGSTTDDNLVAHVPACKESDRTKCPKYALATKFTKETTVELDTDPSAKTPGGQQLEEQVWVAYYITSGELKSSLRLVNDATQGFNENHNTEYTAPAESGPVRFFAVVHDNRGGVSWQEGKIIVD